MKVLLRLKTSVAVILSAALLFMFAIPDVSQAQTLTKETINYVALGDSLAAGVTPYKAINKGYPVFLYERLQQSSQRTVTYQNFGVPGYATSDVLLDFKQNRNNIKQAIKKANIITIDIGANDLLPVVLSGSGDVKNTLSQTFLNTLLIIAKIKSWNPKAQIYIMEYYNPFPYLPAAQQAPLLGVLAQLNNSILLISKMNPSTYYVPTAAIVAQNYLTYLPNPADIHLSLTGYEAVSNQFFEKISSVNNLQAVIQ
ncbi:GDSL-type esterase/lipase family protein [Bacillus sp. 165]|uniref:GDSL-type esterase/lipase family protein n=1 Tax=Bacillus sp. 165 TaxID=1529117 RepID=UPI001ADB1C06|nr:GDSL-type esterase/lipase family protein [Bacillus sp. 165]MBO9130530.1 hypothetical protein [Bacillus sp. 165]